MRTFFIDPGSFNNEFSLQDAAMVADGVGGHTEDWSERTKVFGRIEPISAKSDFGADQSLETTTHRIALRWRDDIASGMRLVWRGRIFRIATVHDPDETGRYLVCRTQEIGL